MPSRSAPAMPTGDRPSRQSFPWCTSKQLGIHQLLRDVLRRGSTAARLVQPHTAPAHASSPRPGCLPCCQVPPRRWVLLRDLCWGAVRVSHSDPRLRDVRCVSLLCGHGSFLPRGPFLTLYFRQYSVCRWEQPQQPFIQPSTDDNRTSRYVGNPQTMVRHGPSWWRQLERWDWNSNDADMVRTVLLEYIHLKKPTIPAKPRDLYAFLDGWSKLMWNVACSVASRGSPLAGLLRRWSNGSTSSWAG